MTKELSYDQLTDEEKIRILSLARTFENTLLDISNSSKDDQQFGRIVLGALAALLGRIYEGLPSKRIKETYITLLKEYLTELHK